MDAIRTVHHLSTALLWEITLFNFFYAVHVLCVFWYVSVMFSFSAGIGQKVETAKILRFLSLDYNHEQNGASL
jgi:hypothetical protein